MFAAHGPTRILHKLEVLNFLFRYISSSQFSSDLTRFETIIDATQSTLRYAGSPYDGFVRKTSDDLRRSNALLERGRSAMDRRRPVIIASSPPIGLVAVSVRKASAAKLPSRPIQRILPFPPGGGTVFVAQAINEKDLRSPQSEHLRRPQQHRLGHDRPARTGSVADKWPYAGNGFDGDCRLFASHKSWR